MVQVLGAIMVGERTNYIGYSEGEMYFLNPVNETWVTMDFKSDIRPWMDLKEHQVSRMQKVCPSFIILDSLPWKIVNLEEWFMTVSNGRETKHIDLMEVVDPLEEEAVMELIKFGHK